MFELNFILRALNIHVANIIQHRNAIYLFVFPQFENKKHNHTLNFKFNTKKSY